jgi:hypothetical protein
MKFTERWRNQTGSNRTYNEYVYVGASFGSHFLVSFDKMRTRTVLLLTFATGLLLHGWPLAIHCTGRKKHATLLLSFTKVFEANRTEQPRRNFIPLRRLCRSLGRAKQQRSPKVGRTKKLT